MKIIEYGHIKPREITCNGCGAILEYTDVDLTLLVSKYAVKCPVCGRKIIYDNYGYPLAKKQR